MVIRALCACIALTCLAGHVELRTQKTPEEAREALEAAPWLAEEEEPGKAVAALRNAAKHFKNDPNAWYYLGLAEIRKGEFESAQKSFKQAQKRHSNFVLAHVGRARSLFLLNNLDEAEREGRRVVGTGAKDVDTHYVFGVVHLLSGGASKSLEEVEASLKINTSFAPAYLLKYQALLLSLLSEGGISKIDLVKRRQILDDSARSLERYFLLAPEAKSNAFLLEQLKTLHAYAEAAGEDSEVLDRQLFRAEEVTTKARVRSKPPALYTAVARAAHIVGKVVLAVVFSAEGEVKHILVLKSLPLGLTEKSIEAARRMKFTPANKDGKPVSMYAQLEYNFTIY